MGKGTIRSITYYYLKDGIHMYFVTELIEKVTQYYLVVAKVRDRMSVSKGVAKISIWKDLVPKRK
jgi:hypothetical protein